jgi:hypothetical protein
VGIVVSQWEEGHAGIGRGEIVGLARDDSARPARALRLAFFAALGFFCSAFSVG